jgi:hypothetical protein
MERNVMRLFLGCGCVFAVASFAQNFDVVIANGRVMGPESGLDAVRNFGIRAGRVAAISETALSGRITIDSRGMVVAPGSHGQYAENYNFKVHDSVTTALELEIGVSPRNFMPSVREKC